MTIHPAAQNLLKSFLSAHEAEATAYTVDSDWKPVGLALGAPVEEYWDLVVVWNRYEEFGRGHWGRFMAYRVPMAGAVINVPTWSFIAFVSPSLYRFSTSREDGCPMVRCEWVRDFLRRYRV